MNRVYLELGPKKVFACSLDWPGWCRIGSSEELAIETLTGYEPRYRLVAERAGLPFSPGDPVVVERVKGTSTTDFGAPDAVAEADRAPMDAEEADRGIALLRAAWEIFDEVAAASPEELRKGPRGGGRDRDRMVAHVVEAERAYARKVGVRHKPFHGDREARDRMRGELVEVLARPGGSVPVPGGWPVRYALRRTAWHVIDHIWEMEDRRD
ncbi:hypothetical protein [Microtetraspora niveoalba]|uniref:hypothetical protein n=1 Tax=Microtetraspora niveoalba TaxID=46175 RepID=UPI00082BAACB|nr:hypothetical protein [Microtetraspora niveoalba]